MYQPGSLFLNGANDAGVAMTRRHYRDSGVEVEEAVTVDISDNCALCTIYDQRVGARIGRGQHTAVPLDYLACAWTGQLSCKDGKPGAHRIKGEHGKSPGLCMRWTSRAAKRRAA